MGGCGCIATVFGVLGLVRCGLGALGLKIVGAVVLGELSSYGPIFPPVTPSGLTSFKGLVGSPLNTTKLARLLLTPGGGVVSTTLTVMLAPALLEAANTGLVMPE